MVFLAVSLGLSMYSTLSSANSDSFTFSFAIWISFSSLINMTRTSKTMLSKSGESGHTCFIIDLRGNAISFSLLSVMLAVGLLYVAFTMLRYIPSMFAFWKGFFLLFFF